MNRQRGDLGERLRRLEGFFYHFLVYVFHAKEGRTMRRWFIRDMIIRTLTYLLGTVPFLVILWYYHLFYGQFPTINAAQVLLVLDFAFGAAFLRTVYVYRHRVHFVYRPEDDHKIQQGEPIDPNEMEEDPSLEKLEVVNEIDEENVLPEGVESPAQETPVDRVILECRKCKRRLAVPATTAARNERCSCGGKLRML